MRAPSSVDRFLAAMPGATPEFVQARMRIAGRFFEMHAVGPGAIPWPMVRRMMQCMDFGQPVVVGPPSRPPPELVRLPATSFLGDGHFMLMPTFEDDTPWWWDISPHVRYLRWFAPRVEREVEPGAAVVDGGDARFFIPVARVPGQRLVRPL